MVNCSVLQCNPVPDANAWSLFFVIYKTKGLGQVTTVLTELIKQKQLKYKTSEGKLTQCQYQNPICQPYHDQPWAAQIKSCSASRCFWFESSDLGRKRKSSLHLCSMDLMLGWLAKRARCDGGVIGKATGPWQLSPP